MRWCLIFIKDFIDFFEKFCSFLCSFWKVFFKGCSSIFSISVNYFSVRKLSCKQTVLNSQYLGKVFFLSTFHQGTFENLPVAVALPPAFYRFYIQSYQNLTYWQFQLPITIVSLSIWILLYLCLKYTIHQSPYICLLCIIYFKFVFHKPTNSNSTFSSKPF